MAQKSQHSKNLKLRHRKYVQENLKMYVGFNRGLTGNGGRRWHKAGGKNG